MLRVRVPLRSPRRIEPGATRPENEGPNGLPPGKAGPDAAQKQWGPESRGSSKGPHDVGTTQTGGLVKCRETVGKGGL